MKNMKKTKQITFSALVVAIYITFMYLTQFCSFGQHQIRFATGLYSLAYYFPFLCLPLGIANMLSNILFGGDIINGLLGFFAGTITALIISFMRKITKKKVVVVIPIVICPSIIMSIWISYIVGAPYYIILVSLCLGQTISAYTVGIGVLYIFERIPVNYIK